MLCAYSQSKYLVHANGAVTGIQGSPMVRSRLTLALVTLGSACAYPTPAPVSLALGSLILSPE